MLESFERIPNFFEWTGKAFERMLIFLMDSQTVQTDANFFRMDRQTVRTNANFFKRFFKSVRKNNERITNAYPLETDNR